MRKLFLQATPTIDDSTRDQLLLHQFLAGIPGIVSLQLRDTGETKVLAETNERGRLLMTIDKQDQAATVTYQLQSDIIAFAEQIAALTDQVAALTPTSRRSFNSNDQQVPIRQLQCYNCNQWDTFNVNVRSITI